MEAGFRHPFRQVARLAAAIQVSRIGVPRIEKPFGAVPLLLPGRGNPWRVLQDAPHAFRLGTGNAELQEQLYQRFYGGHCGASKFGPAAAVHPPTTLSTT